MRRPPLARGVPRTLTAADLAMVDQVFGRPRYADKLETMHVNRRGIVLAMRQQGGDRPLIYAPSRGEAWRLGWRLLALWWRTRRRRWWRKGGRRVPAS